MSWLWGFLSSDLLVMAGTALAALVGFFGYGWKRERDGRRKQAIDEQLRRQKAERETREKVSDAVDTNDDPADARKWLLRRSKR